MTETERYARCAIAFFRGRHELKPRYKNSKRKAEYISNYNESVKMARYYIAKARIARGKE